MSAFHSGTDTQDLVDNAPKLPMFLSLVCNYNCIPFAEIAIAYEVQVKTESKKKMNKWKWFAKEEDEVKVETITNKGTLIIPCDVAYLTDQWILDQIAEVRSRVPVHSAIGFRQEGQGYQHWKAPNQYQTPQYQSPYWKVQQEQKEKERKEASGKDKQMELSYEQVMKELQTTGTTGHYKTMLNELPDLILLGNSTTVMTSKSALDEAERELHAGNMQHYMKAFKEYFENYWFPVMYRSTDATEEVVLDHIIKWSILNKEVWTARQIKAACYELKTEFTILRQV